MRPGLRLCARFLMLFAAGSIVLSVSAASLIAAQKHKPTAEQSWTTYKNPRFGYSLYYPSALFATGQLPEDAGGQTFVTPDQRAKIVVYATLNTDGYSPREYRQTILKEFGGYNRLDYSPIGGTWFVLSGFRGENIYYQKVMFSCRNTVINVFSISFPIIDKPVYEPLIEIMEDHFKPGRGLETSQGC